jgi:hypothetical protein
MYIKPKITQRQAEAIFSIKKSTILRTPKLFSGKSQRLPEKLEIMYLPFYLFDVLVEKESKDQKKSFSPRQYVTLSVDGLLGHAVLYTHDALDIEKNLESPTPACDFGIASAVAARAALNQYKGILLEHGMRTRSQSYATKISEGKKIYYPFWVGYFKKKRGYDFKALDAVSGEIQGVRMRKLFMNALRRIG